MSLTRQMAGFLFACAQGPLIAVLQPETIRAVYQVDACVEIHPSTKQLQVTLFLLAEDGVMADWQGEQGAKT